LLHPFGRKLELEFLATKPGTLGNSDLIEKK